MSETETPVANDAIACGIPQRDIQKAAPCNRTQDDETAAETPPVASASFDDSITVKPPLRLADPSAIPDASNLSESQSPDPLIHDQRAPILQNDNQFDAGKCNDEVVIHEDGKSSSEGLRREDIGAMEDEEEEKTDQGQETFGMKHVSVAVFLMLSTRLRSP